jgi:trehalose 6-phosphate synthase
VREALPEATITHFVHIPWPAPVAWGVLPADMRGAIAEGLLACDVVGFHTARDADEFLRFCADETDAEVERDERELRHRGRRVRVRHYPISIDPDELAEVAGSPEVEREYARLAAERPERLVLRVDRTDPSKNIVRGFRAFEIFLEQHPAWRGRVRMLALLDPSRQSIPEYAAYRARIDETAQAVGARFEDASGRPAIEVRIRDNFPEVVAGYRHYDVLLVNALFDGMNLIAKEAPLVNERDGVLILSENAGAHEELGDFALSVNPFDVQAQADAIAEALEMPEAERRRRAEELRAHVREHDLRRWIDHQLAEIDEVRVR